MEDPNDQRSKGLLGLIVIDTEHYLVPTVFQVFHHIGNLFTIGSCRRNPRIAFGICDIKFAKSGPYSLIWKPNTKTHT